MIDPIIAFNKTFVEQKGYERFLTSKYPDQLQVGLTRLLYPFFCGLLISRLMNSGSIFVAVCIFVLAILVAYGAYKLYDLPVREWLKKK